ncbi:MAG TPA: acyl carrier protein [Chitinophaga sp.]|uniref:acyl carrier protein n=1 Tax=Chitinophaga sp. TaxID=1869181 RepID=UPI002C5B49E6|nr:acyl carrier protein [Chitinophaga sp.]HVI45323.1 acyl carrier protein [Chitinophaga sp.]
MDTATIFTLITSNLRQILPGLGDKQIERSDMLSPLGADSIARAELIEQMLEDLQLQVPRFEFHSATNLGELADLFCQKLEEKQG